MLRSILIAVAVIGGLSAAVAQNDPISQRKAIMKNLGQATKSGAEMAKGEAPFDLGKAKGILKSYADAAGKTHELFPTGSEAGGETAASPKIWENQADFRKQFDEWAASIEKASASVTDLASFRTAFGTVTKACGSCHETYRIKKS